MAKNAVRPLTFYKPLFNGILGVFIFVDVYKDENTTHNFGK